MGKLPEQSEFLRNPEVYTTADLAAYAREIITKGSKKSPYRVELGVSWKDSGETIKLAGLTLESEFPTYLMKVHHNTDGQHEEYAYIFSEKDPYVSEYTVDPITKLLDEKKVENPNEITTLCMRYLRSNKLPRAEEPRNSEWTEMQFADIMANIAIDEAISQQSVDLEQVVVSFAAGKPELSQVMAEAALAQGVREGDRSFPYTRKRSVMQTALNYRAQLQWRRQIDQRAHQSNAQTPENS